jgi:hypothetical protein
MMLVRLPPVLALVVGIGTPPVTPRTAWALVALVAAVTS